ncbi:MAG: 50S ribosomal protein L25/general stress protein Ctc [Rickettsiales bacterium]|nr:50S ribosomal protein L25/general stress protein Ctc [Rickettsiales bacterium]
MNKTNLKVEVRKSAGKGAARSARRANFVPGVIYGKHEEPILINIDPKTLMMELKTPGFKTRTFELDADGKKETCICQNVQFHPVKDNPLHVDFLRISKDKEVKVSVPVVFENKEKNAVLKQGGTLNIIIRSVKVLCPAHNIINEIKVDLTPLNANEAVKLFDLKLPENVKFADTKINFTIANLLPSRLAKMEEKKEAADAKKKK